MKITKATIDRLGSSGRDAIHWDSEVRRFGLRMKPSGVKSYLVQYRNAQGRSRKLTFGQHGTWTPEQARQEAKRLLRLVDQGHDPAEQRAVEREAITVSQFCDDYMERARKGLVAGRGGMPKKPLTIRYDAGRIERHIKPLLGRKIVSGLTQAEIRRFVDSVATGETMRQGNADNGGRGVAKRTLGLLGGILTYAVEAGHMERNPAHGIRRPADGKREVRLEAADYRRLEQALQVAEERGEHWQAIATARLIALTGLRRNEAAHLKWSEVDLSRRCLRLADSKTGASLRPLGTAALRLLERVKSGHAGSAFVFPSTIAPGKPYASFPKAWRRMIAAPMTPHGLRHAFASAAHDLGYSELTIGALLGHAKSGVTAGYIHHADRLLTDAADGVAGFIWGAMVGEADRVVRFEVKEKADA